MKKILCALLLLTLTQASAQLENSNWIFGQNTGLRFPDISAPPEALTGTSIFSTEACASISNQSGELLFYSDGETVYNRLGDVMETGLNGSQTSTQGALIVPKPGSTTNYYLFTSGEYASFAPKGFYYSEIDMTLDGGLGGVVVGNKNIPLRDPSGIAITASQSEKITSISTPDIDYIWVVINHEDSFYSYKVSSLGVSYTPVYISTSFTSGDSQGAMKISPDGEKLALAYSGLFTENKRVDLYDFDLETGRIDNRVNIYETLFNIDSPYGLEFSADSQNVYFSTDRSLYQFRTLNKKDELTYGKNKSKIYQYNLPTKSLELVVEVASTDGFKGLQRGIDDKIYVSQSTNFLSIIHFPNETADLCGFEFEYLDLEMNSNWNFPQWVHKVCNKEWAFDFGSVLSNNTTHVIRDIVTDTEGNVYVMGAQLDNQSAQVTAAIGADAINHSRFFIAKFNTCKELEAYHTFTEPGPSQYGKLRIGSDDRLYAEIHGNNLNVKAIDKTTLTATWVQN
ncbi:MAG: hypothetical protein HRT68_14230, partial [Flavobacteriaceae bacterium]|nr:hypothetical protein [Flavobacteriaceae bacterium]